MVATIKFSDIAPKLTNIPFLWGGSSPKSGMDCFHYAVYLQKIVGKKDVSFDLSSVYAEYPEAKDAPLNLVSEYCKKELQEVEIVKHLNIVMLNQKNTLNGGLGTYIDTDEGPYVCYMSHASSVLFPYPRIRRLIQSYWQIPESSFNIGGEKINTVNTDGISNNNTTKKHKKAKERRSTSPESERIGELQPGITSQEPTV